MISSRTQSGFRIPPSLESRPFGCHFGNDLVNKTRLSKGNLGKAKPRRTLKSCEQMPVSKQELGPRFPKSNLRRTSRINLEDKSVAKIGPQLHGHHVRIRSLCGKYQVDSRGPGFHSQ